MAQNSTFSVEGGDLPVTNYTGVDIAAGIAVQLDTTAGNYMGVVPVTDPANAIGMTLDTIKAGRPGRVRVLGSALGTADGVITAGQLVRASIDGGEVGHIAPCGAGEAALGRALTSAADNAEVQVWIAPARNA